MSRVDVWVPTRVDLAGGTLDINPLCHLFQDAVTVNVAVTVPAFIQIDRFVDDRFELVSRDQNRRVEGRYHKVAGDEACSADQGLPLVSLLLRHFWQAEWGGLSIKMEAHSPQGAGLGGSSALAVGLLAGLAAVKLEATGMKAFDRDQDLLQFVQGIETQLIKVPTGCQDYWAAYRGGVNLIEHKPGGSHCSTLTGRVVEFLEPRMVLCYSGQSRQSAINNWQVCRLAFDGCSRTMKHLNEIAQYSRGLAHSLIQGDFAQALVHSRDEWRARLELWPGIVTQKTTDLDRIGRDAGAMFSRVCGAGGGGVMAFFCEPDRRSGLLNALKSAGGHVMDGGASAEGLRVTVSSQSKLES